MLAACWQHAGNAPTLCLHRHVRGVPGTVCRLALDCQPEEKPEDGDFVRTVPGGSCYRIDRAWESSKTPYRFYLACTRLERDAVELGDPGVWSLHWYRR